MPKQSSNIIDVNVMAAEILEAATRDKSSSGGKNPAAVALGRLGGKKGGPARAKKLSAKKRKDIARRAAQARWKLSG